MIAVNLTRHFQVSGCDRDTLDAHSDAVMDELLILESEQVFDADMSVDLGRMTVSVSIVAYGDNEAEAAIKADSTIRAAIHAANGSTPGWKYAEWKESEHIDRELVTV
jgi:hypothetical protein